MTEPGLVSRSTDDRASTGRTTDVDLRRAQAELARLRRREEMLEGQIAQLTRALDDAEQRLAELPRLRDDYEAARDATHWLEVTKTSLSWRITRPLRWATRTARRATGRRSPPP